MKTTKLLLTLAAGGWLAATGAQAQVEINVSGAVAFRDTSYRAIRSLFLNPANGSLISQNPADAAGTPNQLKVTWSGRITNLFGSQIVTVRAYYNGAVAGIQDLTQDRNVDFLATATPGDTTLSVGKKADIAYSSVFQASTPYTSPELADTLFGVTPVFFVKSAGTPASITNITVQQFRALAANGALPAWFFTGNSNDTQTVYFIQRDPTAGQRTIIQRENGFTGNPISYQWNSNTLSFVIDTVGRNSTQIRDQLNAATLPAISYLTGVDAVNVNGGANILGHSGHKAFFGSYSSVSNNHNQVINGQYTQWGYEHLLSRTTASGEVTSFLNALKAAIDADLQTSAYSLPISRVRVERSSEGGAVTPL
ncbi:MAG TPA: hypothetical protein VFZ59_26670 [Verrucomicrobiae bacterium]|nr:hypothetical protein [Verrucomicrobiae bacterium]